MLSHYGFVLLLSLGEFNLGFQEGNAIIYRQSVRETMECLKYECKDYFTSLLSNSGILAASLFILFFVSLLSLQPSLNRFKMLLALHLFILLSILFSAVPTSFPIGLFHFFNGLSYGTTHFLVPTIVVQTFLYSHRSWYFVFLHFFYHVGYLAGKLSSLYIELDLRGYGLHILLANLVPLLVSAVAVAFIFLRFTYDTPARYLIRNEQQNAKLFLRTLYEPEAALAVMDEIKEEIHFGMYHCSVRTGCRSLNKRIFVFLLFFMFFFTFNGYATLKANAVRLVKSDNSQSQWLQPYLVLHVSLTVLIALVATWTVWRVSRKLLLITCFLLMWHIWVVVFLLERHFTTELPLVGAFLSCSYVLFYEWALGPLRFIICYEMEGIFGNILLNIEFAVLQCLREVFFEQYTRIIDKHIQISFIVINFLVSGALTQAVFFIAIFYEETRSKSRVFLQLGVRSQAISFVNDAILTPSSFAPRRKENSSIVS